MKYIGAIAAVSGALAVALGAFGAHGLKPHLDAYQLDIYNKAVLYHFIHTLALLTCVVLFAIDPAAKGLNAAGYCFITGITLFSGSLYLLATRHLTGLPANILGPITPIGGLFFIAGWVMLVLYFIRK
jgi:uncharacterized membrane protein YgdD (TMEM256/DUF423 family)